MQRPIVLVDAPSNLGLRPLRPGHIPGTWHAPEALARSGLDKALVPSRRVRLPRPAYDTEAQPGTRLRNGQSIRAFNLTLAEAVSAALGAGEFPVVVGGDCSALAGGRRLGPLSLVHVDGHSDFRHPGNYDSADMPAVDAPGSPGIDPADLVVLLRSLIKDARCAGLKVTIFDPSLDPQGVYARVVVSLLHDIFA